jgi:hypothetical protein
MWAFMCVPGQPCNQGLPDGITTTDFVKLKGDQGDQGDIGITGAQGSQGQQGIAGVTGAQGQQGQQGIQGEQGETGVQGTEGKGVWQGLWQESVTYEEGDHVKWMNLPYALICTPGSTCIQGQPGMNNDWLLLQTTGDEGATGTQGTQGGQGNQGQAGSQGLQGRSSFQGTWQDTITYHEGDIVTYNEVAFQLICPEGIACRNDAPTSETSLWQALQIKGEIGQAGEQGTAGVDADIMIILIAVGGGTFLILIVYLFVALKWYYACCPPRDAYNSLQSNKNSFVQEPVDIAYGVMLDKELKIIF